MTFKFSGVSDLINIFLLIVATYVSVGVNNLFISQFQFFVIQKEFFLCFHLFHKIFIEIRFFMINNKLILSEFNFIILLLLLSFLYKFIYWHIQYTSFKKLIYKIVRPSLYFEIFNIAFLNNLHLSIFTLAFVGWQDNHIKKGHILGFWTLFLRSFYFISNFWSRI